MDLTVLFGFFGDSELLVEPVVHDGGVVGVDHEPLLSRGDLEFFNL